MNGWNWLTGWDSWFLTVWLLCVPLVLVYAGVRWLLDRTKR